MADKLTLSEPDVRRLVRLVADALAPDDGRAAKVNRLMAGLCEWVDADGWFWVRSHINPATSVPENYDFLYGGGLTDRHLAVWSERSLEVHGRPPEHVELKRRMAGGVDFTLLRRDVVPDAVWADDANRAYVAQLGYDESIFSIRQLRGGEGVISYVLLLRKQGRPPFESRDARLAHAVIGECGPLHADGLNVAAAADIATLTPRQRNVLTLLVDGLSVKQVADRLGLSRHTINDHCKALHGHFGVSSRAELVRRFMTGRGRNPT